jgi:2-(1,2-epoxy-1,2-dihydrophenyl)acetyl-CoA isomerase
MPYPHPPTPEDHQRPVLAWREGGIAHLRFNRPDALNAINMAMASAFVDSVKLLANDPAVRVVCLAGEGRAFQAGGDIAAMANDPVAVAGELIAGMHGALKLLAAMDAPVIASVHGAVAGGGLGVMLNCDLVIAAEGTKFAIAYPSIGASADCGTTYALPRLVGLRQALQIALLAEPMDAATALRLNLVNAVVPAAELQARTLAWAQRIEASAPLALGRLKRLLRHSSENSFDQQLQAEAQGFAECAATQDFAEGVAAFLTKRPPKFVGR